MIQRSLLPGTLAAMFVWAGCPAGPSPTDAGISDAGKAPAEDAGAPGCPAVAAPECGEDQELESGTDENGCQTVSCVDKPITVECPEPAAPECEDGEVIGGIFDENGCEVFICETAPMDAGTPETDAGTSTGDAGLVMNDAGTATEDAGPTSPTATIQMLLDMAAEGSDDVDYVLEDVYVTYVRTIGYTLQAEAAGPAIFVYSGSTPSVAVGNKVSLQVSSLGEFRSLLQIDGASVISNDEGTYDVLGNFAFDLGAGEGTALTTDAVARLVTVTGARVVSGSARNWVIQYGTNDVESTLYAYEGDATGLCPGAVVDIVNAYVDSYENTLSVKNYYLADFANLDTSGCSGDDAGVSDDAGASDAGNGEADDAGTIDADAGSADDAGVASDAGDTVTDAGVNPDAGDTGDAGTPATSFVINEVDYDNVDADSAEFIELYNGSASAIDLTGYKLLLVNGNGASVYTTIDLSTGGTLAAGQFLVVSSSEVMASAAAISIPFAAGSNNVQNGNPDAIALVSATEVVDALVYEGSLEADLGAPYGSLNFGENSFGDSNSIQGSIARKVDGVDTGDDAADWMFTSIVTPGSANAFE